MVVEFQRALHDPGFFQNIIRAHAIQIPAKNIPLCFSQFFDPLKEMLEIIREHGYVDAEYMYRNILGSTNFFARDILAAKSKNVASWYATREKGIVRTIEKTVDTLLELKNQ